MDPEKQSIDRIRELFTQAQDIANGEERTAFLMQACGENTSLLKEVESLLAAYATTNDFLSRDAAGEALIECSDQIGQTIGHYRITAKLGEGGFGEVFLAEQLEPFKREVALKIIKLGMDTKDVVARFEAERQALARMDHPNIAHAYDAGATESGRPYFVMELVRGVPLTEYCDRNRLSLPDRLHLFRQVCDAVQHAHKKGILHRDLKPSNILVSDQDGTPLPKVIDFGVAKSLQGRLTEETLATLQEMLIGTPMYMSPEQLDQKSTDVDERSDIYSLGVILYELVTGTTPLSHKTPTSMTLAEMRKSLHDQDLPRPSKRFLALGRKTTVIANRRGIKPPTLERLLRGDLDWVIMKAIEKECERRYTDVIALSEDLDRYLNNKPVTAGPPSLRYRTKKLIRRHKTTSGIIASVGITILLGAGIMTYSFFQLTNKPASLIEERGWKLEKFYDMGKLGSNGFGIRPDGSVLIVNEWGAEPKGLYWAKEGGVYSPEDAFSLGSEYVDPEDAVELPEGIYVTDNGPDGPQGTVLRVPHTGGRPTVFHRDQIVNPYDILVAPKGFDGRNVNPNDLLVFDNGMGRAERAAIWSIDRNSATARPLIMGNPMADGFLKGGFAPDGTLYTSLNNHEDGAVCILRINSSGQPEVVLRNFYFSEGKSDKSAGIAVHPITGEVFFSHQKGISAFFPEKTSPRHFLAMNIAAMHWAPDGSMLYLIADKAIWTLSGPGIESEPVSTGKSAVHLVDSADQLPPGTPEATGVPSPVPPPETAADTHYVDLNNPTPVAPYTSWETAAKDIQTAVNAAEDGDAVVVTNGTYRISSEIQIRQNLTVRSVNGPESTVVDANGKSRGFRIFEAAGPRTLRGFTVIGGVIDYENGSGGGISAHGNGRLEISDCIIKGNRAEKYGGGIHVLATAGSHSSVLIRNCIVLNNAAGIRGGGINTVMPHHNTGIIRVEDCTVSGNKCPEEGGGIRCYSYDGLVAVARCLVTHNSGGQGGGVMLGTKTTITDSLIYSNEAVLNSGGGIRRGGPGGGKVINCTVSGNTAATAAGGAHVPWISNSIIYGNSAPRHPDIMPDSHVEYSCSPSLGNGTIGNINTPPNFINPISGNYRLKADSPCIDAGALVATSVDLDKNPRTVDGNGDGKARVDIGVFEFQP